jgi:hypothetical protein
MIENRQGEPLTMTILVTELGEVEKLLIELAGRLSALQQSVELARSRKQPVPTHERESNTASLSTPLTDQAIQGESLSGDDSDDSFNFGPLPSIQWKEQIERRNETAQIARTGVPGLAEWRESARVAAQKAAPKKKVAKVTPWTNGGWERARPLKARRAATVDPIDWRNI